MAIQRIWMLGTSPDGQGGIASVIDQYRVAGLFDSEHLRFETTHHDKNSSGRVLPFLKCASKLWPSLVLGRVSLIHAHTSYGGSFWRKLLLVLPAMILGVPVVTHLHAGSFIEFHAKGSNWRRYWMRYLFRHASRVVVLSEEWRDWVASVEPAARVAVVPNSLANSTGISSPSRVADRPTVLFLGRVGVGKGAFDLLRAFASVVAKLRTARLVIGGDGDIDRLSREVKALGLTNSVEYVGWADREGKARLLGETWVLALPSYKEGLPMGIIEAMAFSRAVVSCPVGGVASAVSEGQTGFLVQPGDVEKLASRLEQILSSESLARELGIAARRAFEQKFSHEVALPRILDIYRDAGVSEVPQLQLNDTEKPSKPGKSHSRIARFVWLFRRLCRIYPAEIPYRITGVIRGKLQQHGLLDARRIPTLRADAHFGDAWIMVPGSPHTDSEAIIAEANRISRDGVRIFDIDVSVSKGRINWNIDPKTGHPVDMAFGLSIDFRHVAAGVDIKYLWELNRHIWWVPIAQAYAISGKPEYLDKLSFLVEDWLSNCPYPLGPNWSSPVEHGIRLINWSIVWHLIGAEKSPMFRSEAGEVLRERWLASIYQHMRFARDNYSFYSSSDNHLIGEAAGIYVATRTWDLWDESRALGAEAKSILEKEMTKQFAEDGVNLEQAMCYHKFSLEFLLAAQLCGLANNDDFSLAFKTRMLSALEFMAAMMDCTGKIPSIGDSDDGKVFGFIGDGSSSPYESLLRAGAVLFGASALTRKLGQLGVKNFDERLWLLVPMSSVTIGKSKADDLPVCFDKGGYVLLGQALHSAGEIRITMDVGPLGYNRIAGHGHADALSVLLSCQGKDFLIDPGTYCYNAAPELRKYFRGTSAHNTVVIDDTDQSIYGGSFLWLRDVVSTLHHFSDAGLKIIVEASHDGYMRLADPVRHIRKLTFDRGTLDLWVEDRFECKKQHACKLHWHFSPECLLEKSGDRWVAFREIGMLSVQVDFADCRVSIVEGRDSPPLGWVSRRFYEKHPTQVLIFEGEIKSTSTIKTHFKVSGQ